jgi:hypothetical protein
MTTGSILEYTEAGEGQALILADEIKPQIHRAFEVPFGHFSALDSAALFC